jgi:tRNA isopentenyl-2-thiomethyl-A-37 hydroxylase MiaE
LLWAVLQLDLGNALEMLGKRESGTTPFEEAGTAYADALKEWSREHTPLQWAAATGGQGVVLSRLAERLGDPMAAQTAIRHIKLALETMRDSGQAPAARHYQSELTKAKEILDQLSKRCRL